MLARRAELLNKVAAECAITHQASGLNEGGKFVPVQIDVSDKAQVASLFDKIPLELRNVDILGGLIGISDLVGCIWQQSDPR